MRNAILTLAFCISFATLHLQGQAWTVSDINDGCGTWEVAHVELSEWATLDTIGSQPIGDEREWVYDEMKLAHISSSDIFCPCGCGDPLIYKQRRVCRLTGILQEQTTVQTYKYIPKTETEFETVIKNLAKPR